MAKKQTMFGLLTGVMFKLFLIGLVCAAGFVGFLLIPWIAVQLFPDSKMDELAQQVEIDSSVDYARIMKRLNQPPSYPTPVARTTRAEIHYKVDETKAVAFTPPTTGPNGAVNFSFYKKLGYMCWEVHDIMKQYGGWCENTRTRETSFMKYDTISQKLVAQAPPAEN